MRLFKCETWHVRLVCHKQTLLIFPFGFSVVHIYLVFQAHVLMVLSIFVTEVFILTAQRGKCILSSVSNKIAILKSWDVVMVAETKVIEDL